VSIVIGSPPSILAKSVRNVTLVCSFDIFLSLVFGQTQTKHAKRLT
jgi:hypothetical protein